jgi:sugar/nucleoside kinase (ribokinase family)
MSVDELTHHLAGTTAVLPSAQEVGTLLERIEPAALALDLNRAGFAEVLIKRGEDPVVLANDGVVHCLPVVKTRVVDPTGAGDSFCGAYAACRLLGYSPIESARRAIATAALIVSCSGVEAAMKLSTPTL